MPDIRVLVLDDEADEAKLYSKMIESMGFECSCVSSSKDAGNFLKEKKADILILDVYLKEQYTGIQLLPWFKKQFPGLVIIVMTHSLEMNDPIEAIKNGADDFLTKPFGRDMLGQRLESSVEKFNREKTNRAFRAARDVRRVV